jgi:hypothetical protein
MNGLDRISLACARVFAVLVALLPVVFCMAIFARSQEETRAIKEALD